jgi:NAD(P)-dependent dehydrogenase (short-subunit alcohol dehydrogenase family)
MHRLENKVAIVTGGSLGIGKSVCILLAKEGAKVAVTDILDKEGKYLVNEINSMGYIAEYRHLDISDEENVKDVFTNIHKKFGKIDIMVNNAGIAGVNKPTHEITSEEWDTVMNINVKGVFFCTKYVIPFMKEAGGGSIINMSSVYGLVGNTDIPPYHASKGAVRLMTKTDALFYAKDKIRVNSIHPGFIKTPLVENFLKPIGNIDEGLKVLESLHPLGHLGEPDDIGYGVVYLASDESKFMTGSELVIDGGYTAR